MRTDLKTDFIAEIHELHAELCQALADPKRILILYSLAEHSLTVGELTDQLGIRQSNVSQHLSVLRDRGLVAAKREGTSVHYSLKYPSVVTALDLLRGVLKERLAEARNRADRLMESAL